jgi:uncharacterized membrane protein
VSLRYNYRMSTSPAHGRSTNRRWRARLSYAAVAALAVTWLLLTPDGLLGKADAVGYAVCHRIDLRSFHLGQRALPLCARCTGMYLAALLGLAYFSLRHPRAVRYPRRSIVIALALFALAWAVDGLNSFLSLFPTMPHMYAPSNTLRLMTGAGIGLALAAMIYPAFNQVAWRAGRDEPILRSWGELLLLLALTAGLVALVLNGNPAVLYPLALLSAAGVLVLLTTAYALIAIPFLRGMNSASAWKELIPGLILAAGLALLQVGAIDVLRWLLTGTWDGFHL